MPFVPRCQGLPEILKEIEVIYTLNNQADRNPIEWYGIGIKTLWIQLLKIQLIQC